MTTAKNQGTKCYATYIEEGDDTETVQKKTFPSHEAYQDWLDASDGAEIIDVGDC